MYCSICGNKQEEGAAYCPYCGAKIIQAGQTGQPAQPNQQTRP
ncbi:MAG TPA: zinc ribbon domain-containing protein, partial [Lachnospiraceae bacterium]|nr:zinc ribbon domain-containing protein [Lachnospiraceae bacterium]